MCKKDNKMYKKRKKTVYWDLINSNVNKRDVQTGCSLHTDVSRNLATVVVLPELRRIRTGLLPSGPKSSFQMRESFVFHLETKVLESGGRVEKLQVLSFHSL